MLLEDAGYEVETCDDPEGAATRAIASKVDLIVAGVLSGFELCSRLRPHGMRVVLTSADADQQMAQQATDAGAYALVRKGSLRDSELTRVLSELRQPA